MNEETDTVVSINITEWKNEPSVGDLDYDLQMASSSQEDFKDKLRGYKLTRDGGKVIKASKPGKSTSRPLVVRKSNEWKYPAMEEPFLSTQDMYDIRPRTFEDVEAAKQNSLILNYQWGTKVPKVKVVGDIVRTIVDDGTVIVKTGWDAEYGTKVVEEEQPVYATPEESLQMMQEAVANGQMSEEEAQARMEMGEPMQKGTEKVYTEKETLTVNQPTYEVCINANVTIDPTCEGIMANANFLAHEYDVDMATLKKDAYIRTVTIDQETGKEIVEERGFYHNLDNVAIQTGETTDDEFMSDAANNFNYQDKPRKKLRAKEYWGYWDIHGDGSVVSIVATWINNTMIRMEENPFPHKRIPFSLAVYMPVKQEIHGEPDAAILKENQSSIGRMTRAAEDITATVAVGQTFIDENFFPSPTQKNNYEKGNTVYHRGGMSAKNAIHKTAVEQVPGTVFDMIAAQTADAEALTGTRPFNTGTGGAALNSTATGVRSAMDATSKRELSVLRRLSELFIDMGRMTIAMNQEFLSEEEVVRVTNKEFVIIRRDDLAGEFDLTIDVSTPERDNETADKLMTLMQTNAANMDPEIAKMHYVKIAELWKMPALAEAVGSYEQQADPRQEELMGLQIEEQKLKNALAQKQLEDYDSKIYERLSRTEENATGDSVLKQAKAEESLARAKEALAIASKLEAETDILDQDFIHARNGGKRKEQIEDLEYAASVKHEERQQAQEHNIVLKDRDTLAKASMHKMQSDLKTRDANNL